MTLPSGFRDCQGGKREGGRPRGRGDKSCISRARFLCRCVAVMGDGRWRNLHLGSLKSIFSSEVYVTQFGESKGPARSPLRILLLFSVGTRRSPTERGLNGPRPGAAPREARAARADKRKAASFVRTANRTKAGRNTEPAIANIYCCYTGTRARGVPVGCDPLSVGGTRLSPSRHWRSIVLSMTLVPASLS
jgi:hypothetical protein